MIREHQAILLHTGRICNIVEKLYFKMRNGWQNIDTKSGLLLMDTFRGNSYSGNRIYFFG
jgi:hypothetical protein